jgi:hypothetical protein
MTENPATPAPPPTPRVTVVDFDMPFGSMIVFMLKWAIAAIPAMLILVMLGGIATAVFAGVIAGLASTVTESRRLAARVEDVAASSIPSASTPALVVTVRPTATGWQVTSGSSVTWRKCSLAIAGHALDVPTLSSNAPFEVASAAFSNGGVPRGAPIADRDVSMLCLSPENQQGRIYLFP